MAHRSFDSVTRIGLPQAAPKSLRGDHHGEQFADEGTLILEPSDVQPYEPSLQFNPFEDFEPAPISVAPSSIGPRSYPPPPSSARPVMHSVPPPSSVRPPMNSWDDRVWSVPVSERTSASAITSTSAHRKKTMSPRERSASAMLFIATAALLSALAAIGLMHKAEHRAAAAASETAESAPPPALPSTAVVLPATTTEPSPLAAPVAPPVAIDMDDVKPTPAPVAAPVAPKPAVAAAPANDRAYAAPAYAAPANAAPAPASTTKPAKEKAPPSAAQQKALEDLLDQLGEEQLKR